MEGTESIKWVEVLKSTRACKETLNPKKKYDVKHRELKF